MSALNTPAPSNAVGVHVNAVAVEPEHKKKRTPKIVRKPQKLREQAVEQEDKERWKLDVLYCMDVTRVVFHFEMSALNAAAYSNAVGVHVNAVTVEPEHKKKRTPKIVREPQRSWEQAVDQEDKKVEVGRTLNHGRHPSRVPH